MQPLFIVHGLPQFPPGLSIIGPVPFTFLRCDLEVVRKRAKPTVIDTEIRPVPFSCPGELLVLASADDHRARFPIDLVTLKIPIDVLIVHLQCDVRGVGGDLDDIGTFGCGVKVVQSSRSGLALTKSGLALLAGHSIGLAVGEKHCLPESVEDRKAGKQCRNPADINLVPGKQCHTHPPITQPGHPAR